MGLDLFRYDQELKEKTGKNLLQLTWELSALPRPLGELQGEIAAVVPVTAGKGLIPGFAGAVNSILRHLGLNTIITGNADVAGMGEAVFNGASVMFCADDRLFLALDLRSGRYVDNAKATAEMYMFTMEQMAGGFRGKKALIIGLGKVGLSCLNYALKKNATVSVYDLKPQQCVEARKKIKGIFVAELNLEEACRAAEIVIDASPGGKFIPAAWLRDDVFVAAPGIPLGLTDDAYDKFRKRLVHDPLPLGVAGMAAIIFGTRYS